MLNPETINPYNAYQDIIKEYFDIMDKRTRDVLLNINEADQNQVLASLASKLYKDIVGKVTDIDYGKIPESKGDITKIPNFQEMMECLDTVGGIIEYYKETPDSINTIREAIENLKDSKRIWEKAFATKCEFPMLFYTSIALAIVSATSLILSTSVDYVNDPNSKTFSATLDKNRLHKSKDSLLLKNLRSFNKSYKKKDIEKVMTSLMKAQQTVQQEGVISNTINLALNVIMNIPKYAKMIALVIPILHELTCLFYSAKQSISDYFFIQANTVAMNAEKAREDVTKTAEEREKIYNRQMKLSQKFRKISNALTIKFNKGETKANKMISDSEKPNYKIDDVVDEEPDSYSKIF